MKLLSKQTHILSKTIGLCSLGIISLSSSQAVRADPPNIIFIMSDDHAWQAVSAYKDRFQYVAPTPNIDRIAREGMRFDRCLVTNSICGPSRATVLTGTYSHMNNFPGNIRPQRHFEGSQQTFPKLLQAGGYYTAMIGKWHLGSDPTGFDHWVILPGQGHYYNPTFINENGHYDVHGYVGDIMLHAQLEELRVKYDDTSLEDAFILRPVEH